MNRAHDFLLIVKRNNGDVAISATRRNDVVRCAERRGALQRAYDDRVKNQVTGTGQFTSISIGVGLNIDEI
jgi:hypothetical protein